MEKSKTSKDFNEEIDRSKVKFAKYDRKLVEEIAKKYKKSLTAIGKL